MAISFDNIPTDLRVPLFYAELSSGSSAFSSAERLIIVGQKLATGTATVNEPVLISGGSLIEDTLFGQGSMLAAMFKRARQNAPFQEIWGLPVADAGGAVAATGSIDYAGVTLPVTVTTTMTVYIAGREYNVTVVAADTAATIAAKVVAEIADDPHAPFTAVVNANAVDLTARHAGTLGNSIDIRTNLYGDESALSHEVAITAMNGGATDPDITTALAGMTDGEFLWLASPYADATNLDALETFYSDTSGRWSPAAQLYGHAVTAKVDTVANLSTLGNTRNDKHVTMVGINALPSPVWEMVGALGGKVALHLSDAPELSRPMFGIELSGIVAPRQADRFSITDRNTLLYDGVATLKTSRDGSLVIERLVTTYRLNSQGIEDATFLDIQMMAQAQYLLRYIRAKVVNRHGRQALADDTTPRVAGVTRPKDIKSTIIAGYEELIALGVVENGDAFAAALVVERHATDANRVDVSLPFDVVNQLRVLAVQAVANLQF